VIWFFLTARPSGYKGFFENTTHDLLTAIHLHASVSILAGDTTHIVGNQRMASKKYENFKQYSMLFPEYSFVFIGDSGQGDIYLATLALNDPEIDVLAVFIHDIISTPIIRRKEYQSQGIFLCDNYISAGIMAWQLELISSAGLLRIIEASINDFYGIQWRKTKNHLHLQQQRLWELYSAIFFYFHSFVTFSRSIHRSNPPIRISISFGKFFKRFVHQISIFIGNSKGPIATKRTRGKRGKET